MNTLDLVPSSQSTLHFEGDVRNYQLVEDAVQDVDGVIHLAALSRVRWGFDNPNLCMQVNAQGTLNVLDAIRKTDCNPWIIFGSSREVYGNALVMPVKEDAAYSPTNVYAVSKVSSEMLCQSYHRNYGVSCVILRFSNVYGSIFDHCDRVVPRFVLSALAGIPLHLFGKDHTFDFVHLSDAVRGIRLTVDFMENSEFPIIEAVQLVTGAPTSLEDLANLVLSISESDSEICVESPESYFPTRFFGDPSKALSLLRFEATIDIETGISQLVSDYRSYFEQTPEALTNFLDCDLPIWVKKLYGEFFI